MEEEKLKKKKEKARITSNRRLFADACNDLASYYAKHQRYSDALDEYELQASICDELGLQIKWAACQRMIGEMYLIMAQFDLAMKYVRHHWDVAKNLNNLIEEVKAMETIGRIHLVQGQSFSNKDEIKTSLKAAEKAFMESLALCESRPSKTSQHDLMNIQAKILLNLGDVQEHLGFFDKAINYIGKAITICLNEGLYDVLHNCYTTEASMHSNKRDYAKALSCLNRALEVASKLKDQALKTCEALALKADILCKMSDYEGARQVLLQAWKLETSNEKERKNIESNLKVVVAMRETEELVKSSNPSDHVTYKKLYEKLGDGACRLKNYAGAVDCYLRMLSHAVWAGDSGKTIAPIYVSLYQTYKDMGCYDKALAYCEKEYELIKDEPKEAVTTLNNIAEILFLANKPYSAVEKASIEARNAFKKLNPNKYETKLLKSLLRYQMRYGETDKMEETKAKLCALGYKDFDNLENSEDAAGDDADTTHVGDDVHLEGLPDLSNTNDHVVADEAKPRDQEQSKETNDINITKNPLGETLLHRACMSGNKNKVESLVAKGHSVNIRDNEGWLPLHDACVHGRLEIVNILINNGADINATSHCGGKTPLHVAAGKGHLDLVQLLLEKGAIPSVKDKMNETPLDTLQNWRILQYRLTKEKETIYKRIRNEMMNLIKNTSGVDYNIFESKCRLKPIQDMTQPSTSKSSNNIQDVITIYDSDEEIAQNNRNHSTLASNSTNMNQATQLVLKSNNIKKEMEWSNSNDVNKNISDNFEDSKNVCSNDIAYKSVMDISRQLIYCLSKNTASLDLASESKIPVKPIKEKSLPSTKKIGKNKKKFCIDYDNDVEIVESQNIRDDDSGINKQNNTERKLSKPSTAGARKPSLDNPKIRVKDINKLIEPSVNSNDTKKQTNLRIKTNVNENNNVQDKNMYSKVIAANSMLNTSKEVTKRLIESTSGINFDPVNPIKDTTLPNTSKISKNTYDFLTFDDSIDSDEFPVVDVKKSITPAKDLSTSNSSKININIHALHNTNNQREFLSNDLETLDAKSSNHKTVISGVKEYKSDIRGSININASKIPEEEVNKSISSEVLIDKLHGGLAMNKLNNNKKNSNSGNVVTNPLVKSKKNTKLKNTWDSKNVDLYKNSPNSDASQDNKNKSTQGIAAESAIITSREINDSLTKSSIDIDTSESNTPVKPIKDISQPRTLNMNSNIQNNKNHTTFPPNEYLDGHLINRNASDFPEDDTDKSIPALLAPSEVSHDKLDDNLGTSKDHENRNKRKQRDPSTAVAKKRLLNSRKNSTGKTKTMTKPLTESQKTKQNKTQVSDKIDVNKNSPNSDNFQDSENDCSQISVAISMQNISRELKNSLVGSGFNFDTSELNTPMSKSMPESSTVKLNSNIQNKNLTFSSNEIESSNAHSSNHETETLCVKEHINPISTSINRSASPSIPEDKLRPNDNVNKENSNSDNFQVIEKVCAKVIPSNSMCKDLNDGGADFETLVTKIPVNPVKDMTLPSSLEISNFIQELQTTKNHSAVLPDDTKSSDHHQLVYNEPEISGYIDKNKPVPTFVTPNNVTHFESDNDMAINERNNKKQMMDKKNKNKRKLNESSPVVVLKPTSDTHNNHIENIDKATEPSVKRKKSTECIIDTRGKLNDTSIEKHGDLDFDTLEPKTPVNAIKNIVLPTTSDISNYIQESQKNRNETTDPSEDAEFLNDQPVYHKSEIFGHKAHRRALSASTKRNATKKKNEENKTRIKRRQMRKETFSRNSSSHNNGGFDAVQNINHSKKDVVNSIKPINNAEPSNNCPMQTLTVPPATVKVYIGDKVLLISLDLDTINTLTISWLIEKIRSEYFKLSGSNPEFILMTCDGVILLEDYRLNSVLSSPELKACFTNCEVSSKEARELESRYAADIYDEITRDITDDVLIPHDGPLQSTLPHVDPDESPQTALLSRKHETSSQLPSSRPESPQPTSLCPEHDTWPQAASPRPESPQPSPLCPKHDTWPQAASPRPESPQPSPLCPKHDTWPQAASPRPESPQPSPLCPKHDTWPQPASSRPESPQPSPLCPKHDTWPQPASSRPESPQPSPLCPKHDTWPQPASSRPESPQPSPLCPKHDTWPQPASSRPESPQPTSLCPKHEKLSQPRTLLSESSLTSSLCTKHENSPESSLPRSQSPQSSSLCPKYEKLSRLRSPLSESPLTFSVFPKHETPPQPRSPRPKSPRPGSLAQPTPGCGFAGPALPSKSMQRPGLPTDSQNPVIPLQTLCFDEQELDDDILLLLGDAPKTEIRLGPPVHKAVAKSWQEILAMGLQKEATDQIMEVYSVPANCDLLLAPTLNPEVKATIHDEKVNLDSSLMEQQKQLGLAISALGTAVNSILLNETSKQIILKPISDACRLLCDLHFRETETRRHNVITGTDPKLQDSLVNTVRGNQLFGDNVMEKIKTVKCIQQSGKTISHMQRSAFDLSNNPNTSKGK